jgi:hypothetical protein
VTKEFLLDTFIEKGTPFVDHMKNESDSALSKYSLLFSQFPREDLSVSISKNGVDYTNIKLEDSKLMPLVKEADIYIDSTVFKLYLKIDASKNSIRSGMKDSRSFRDTIFLN